MRDWFRVSKYVNLKRFVYTQILSNNNRQGLLNAYSIPVCEVDIIIN